MNLLVKWMADDAERRACIAEHPDSILVSPDMPLRANLSVLDNIALIPQYRDNLGYDPAADQAWSLLPLQAGDVPDTEADVAELIANVGYRPVVSVEEGVANFVRWYRDYPHTAP